ncbi:MAG TPA: hypothetical protein PK765_02215 [bacterium]|nr:hypothetical protein [bacterium]
MGFVATTAGGTYGNAAGWSISKNNKTTWIPPASGVSPPGTINRIEKLCLPRYVDGQNMNQTFF